MRVAAVALCLMAVPPLSAQIRIVPGTVLSEYARMLELEGTVQRSLALRSYGNGVALPGDGHPWATRLAPSPPGRLRPLPIELRAVGRSAMPRAALDGAMWSGKGVSGSVTAGAEASFGPLTVIAAPTAWFAGNAAFPLSDTTQPNRSTFAYPWTGSIDWPARHGPDPVGGLDPGQSSVFLTWGIGRVAFGSENMWWGPAVRNPLLMGSTAPGFLHGRLGTSRPVDIAVGTAEAQVLWGELRESSWFDVVPENDRRFLVGVTAAYQPAPLPGLTLGFHRMFYKTWDSVDAGDVFAPFQALFKNAFGAPTDPGSNDDRDQMLSLSARWVLTESRAAGWVEWGRNDHNLDLRDFLQEPEHSRAWTIGFEKAFGSGNHRTHLMTEFTQLGRSGTFVQRPTPTWYTHHRARQGYTHRGQLVAAPIGPGSESQHLQVFRYGPGGRWGVSATRVVFNNDAYYRRNFPTRRHEVDLTGAIHALRWFGPAAVSVTLDVTRTLNRWFEDGSDVTGLNVSVEGRWSW